MPEEPSTGHGMDILGDGKGVIEGKSHCIIGTDAQKRSNILPNYKMIRSMLMAQVNAPVLVLVRPRS